MSNVAAGCQLPVSCQDRNYLGWIAQARREETRAKRLAQMLDELERGGVYMNMAWRG